VAKSENRSRELVQQQRMMEEKHASDIQAARRDERTKVEEHSKESKAKLREDLEASFNRREQSSKSLADTHKEHALSMLRREMEMELDKEKHSRVVAERKLNSLKEQHKREMELLQAQGSADRERAERKHATEMARKEEETKQQLEMAREEKKEAEENLK